MSQLNGNQQVEVDKAVDEALARGDISGARRVIEASPQYTHPSTADKVGKACIEAGNFSAAESVAKAHPGAHNTSFHLVERVMDHEGASAAIKKAAELDCKAGIANIERRAVDSGNLAEPVLPEFLRSTTQAHASDLHWKMFDKGL